MARYHSTGNPAIDLGIFAAAVGIFFLVRLAIQHWPKLVYCFARKTREYAKVRDVHASAYAWSKRGDETDHIHTASFELQDGQKIKLHITHDDYIMLRVGSEGWLIRKGGWFLGFEPGEKSDDAVQTDILTHEIET
ncbi:MAG: DUF2500 family protein [Clostridia bacterium]|nr:DUF2500 family protein [Clostridia bacterium]